MLTNKIDTDINGLLSSNRVRIWIKILLKHVCVFLVKGIFFSYIYIFNILM